MAKLMTLTTATLPLHNLMLLLIFYGLGFNPLRYWRQCRIKTGTELLVATDFLEQNFDKVTSPILIMHGKDDKVTDPASSRLLFDHCGSQDKQLELYEGTRHGTMEETTKAWSDMFAWVQTRSDQFHN